MSHHTSGAANSPVATKSIDFITFSFLTYDDVRKHSNVQITKPQLLDFVGRPLQGGLYDPSLGPLNDRENCRKCGERSTNCPGHCGHIELLFPVYNPLLFNFLHKLLERICFFCYHFRIEAEQVERCVNQLEFIAKGDIVGAKKLELDSGYEASHQEQADETCYSSQVSQLTGHSDGACHIDNGEHFKLQQWTSVQFTEAMAVLNNFLKKKTKKCKNCKATNPKITKPTFGLFLMSGMSSDAIRANIIRGRQINGTLTSESEGLSDVDDAESHAKHATVGKRNKNSGDVFHEFAKQKDVLSKQLSPLVVKDILELFWDVESRLCSFICDIQQQGFKKEKAGPSMFFLETILVPPIKFRPPTKGGDSVMEHPHTVLLSKVLQANISLGDAHNNKEHTKVSRRWLDLQESINVLFDSKTSKGPGQKDTASGICQLLEKKEGLFRQKMMGKRVNYACRSVISPDPYLGVNEIGIPPCFAVKLTYPESVTPWNLSKLRNAVINGPENHPGATHYVDKLSINKLPPSRKMRTSISRKLPSTRGAVIQPGKSSDCDYEGKIVYRHLQDGDVVLVNRQPTLHKPSIMAHVVRVLKGEKTLRMHYANCSTYNADFDGDEMNVHFPQDEISRAEAYNIVNANNQYVRPSNGEPLRALIQDHIVSAVLLTKKDTFLLPDDFYQLLYSSGISTGGPISFHGKPGRKVFLSFDDELKPDYPAVLKPVTLWTGKQVITTMLNHITRGHPPITVQKEGKISGDFFKSRSSDGKQCHGDESRKNKDNKALEEEKMLIYQNYMVRGVIDKGQFGEYGLVHTVQELFGPNIAGTLLSVMSRLFTAYLQMHGFTCGVDDLLIMKNEDDARKKLLEICERSGEIVHRNFIGIKDETVKLDPVELQLNIEKILSRDGDSALAYLDRQMKNELNSKTSSGVINDLLSDGLVKPPGKNCISLMTTSGAKGSKVNFQQISSFLGQQELEGKRVPRMISGKTLPCFHPFDWAARAGGYIIDRFLSGLRPQEYYFHCMAGREGLVDTAVKTSRSGYLQRCLIKNLECLKINYDHTVRDADGSIVQFCYGEDGVDVHQTSFMSKFETLAMNREMIDKKCGHEGGSFNSYISELPEALKDRSQKFLDDFSLMERISSNIVKNDDLLNLVKQKFLLSLAQAGEPVGVLAAQSVGEPSTQMTLNTFHLAGRGEMNVTLGIPRLQEILMTASSDIKTPIMTCPLLEGKTEDDADRLADKLKKVTVADIVESMEVSVIPFSINDDDVCRIYKLKMQLHKPAHYPRYANISLDDWKVTLEVNFVRELEDAVQNHMVLLSRISGIKNFLPALSRSGAQEEESDEFAAGGFKREEGDNDNNDDNDNDDGEGAEDLGQDAEKRKRQTLDEMDYDDGFQEEINEGDSSTDEQSSGYESGGDLGDNEIESGKNDMVDKEHFDNAVENKSVSKPKNKKEMVETKRKERVRAKLTRKEFDRAVSVAVSDDMCFEICLKFTNEPHILLTEIARKAAKKVYIQNPGKIEQCRVIDCKESQVIYYGKNPKKRVDVEPNKKEKIPALQTTGVDFNAFWKMQNDLDIRYIYSNSIDAMLKTYGVEAARETIIREVNHVFKSYGISVNTRHLALIADFMTHSGDYRPMSRLGGIAESVSPFSKMSFETASKFIVEAALHGETDNLETPSARICLGLPVKMGTGSFDLMQKLEI